MIAAIREHLAAKEPGLHNDLQHESWILGNCPIIPVLGAYGTLDQKRYVKEPRRNKVSKFYRCFGKRA